MKKFILSFILLLIIGVGALFASSIPPTPQEYFNDYAGLVSKEKAQQLNQRLIDFNNQTSSQVVVAVFPTLSANEVLEDYTQRVAQSWGVGTDEHSNGVVLFVFYKAESDGKTNIRIEVGYGLEEAIPDAVANRIIQEDIIPHFKAAKAGAGTPEWDAGFDAGVSSLLLAAQGQYEGSSDSETPNIGFIILLLVVVIIIAVFVAAHSEGGSGGGYSSSGSSFGGGSSGSSFSGGGGSFGGGGSSGRC